MLINLWTSLAYAGLNDPYDPDNPGLLVPIIATLAGLAIVVFSKSRAEQQGARMGMEPQDSGVKVFMWIYRVLGLGLAGYGISMLVGA